MEKKLAVTCMAALLIFSLTGCQGDSESAPPPYANTVEFLSPSPSISPEPSVSPMPERTPNPNLNQELIDFPDLDGFEKIIVDAQSMVVYNNGLVSMAIQYLEATQEQLDELSAGGGPSLDPITEQLVGKRTVSERNLIDLPGLNRKGLELKLQVDDGNEYVGLIVPSQGQVLALFGMSLPIDRQVLLDGYNQLIEKLTV